MNTNCFNQDNPQLDPQVLAILQYNTTSVSIPNTTAWDETMDVVCRDLNLTELVPLNPTPVPQSDMFIRIDISFQTKAGELNYGFMNNTSWAPLNGSNLLELAATQENVSSVQGVDPAFPLSTQLVVAVPQIHTVEYPTPKPISANFFVSY